MPLSVFVFLIYATCLLKSYPNYIGGICKILSKKLITEIFVLFYACDTLSYKLSIKGKHCCLKWEEWKFVGLVSSKKYSWHIHHSSKNIFPIQIPYFFTFFWYLFLYKINEQIKLGCIVTCIFYLGKTVMIIILTLLFVILYIALQS